MARWHERFGWLVCVLTLALLVSGCAKREYRKVHVHEETQYGEVEEAPRGEMIVE
jgi:hypothetical protein